MTRIHPLKWDTIELFLSAAEHWDRTRSATRPLRFVVVGGGPLLPALKERASRLPDGSVTVTGELINIPDVMNESDVVLGMASTCQQGLACGKPVIAVGDQGYTAVVAPENFEFLAHRHFNVHTQISSNQPEALCQQIQETVFSPQRSQVLSEFGRKIALERFDSRIGARQLEEIYEHLTNNNDSSSIARARHLGDLLLSYGSLLGFRVRRRIKMNLARLNSSS